MSNSKKAWPILKDDDVDEFVERADLSVYDWGRAETVSHEFDDKDARVTFRLPERQLQDIKSAAERRGIKYQRFMRELLERGLRELR